MHSKLLHKKCPSKQPRTGNILVVCKQIQHRHFMYAYNMCLPDTTTWHTHSCSDLCMAQIHLYCSKLCNQWNMERPILFLSVVNHSCVDIVLNDWVMFSNILEIYRAFKHRNLSSHWIYICIYFTLCITRAKWKSAWYGYPCCFFQKTLLIP